MTASDSQFATIIQALNPAQNSADIAAIEKGVELIQAQCSVQSDTMGMVFFPGDGRCYSCGANLITEISEERLRTKCITGCPSCHHAFVG